MRINYHSDTDSVYIHLTEKPGVEAHEVAPGIVIDFDEKEKPVGIDIENAKNVIDLSTIDIHSFPMKKVSWLIMTKDQKWITNNFEKLVIKYKK